MKKITIDMAIAEQKVASYLIAPAVEHTVFDTTGTWRPWRPRFLRSTLRPFQPKRRGK